MKPTQRRLLHILGIAILLISSMAMVNAAYAGEMCSGILSSTNEKSIDQRIRDLSALRVSLDIGRALGDEAPVLDALAANYRRQERALVEYIDRTQVITRVEFAIKMKQEIIRLEQNLRQKRD